MTSAPSNASSFTSGTAFTESTAFTEGYAREMAGAHIGVATASVYAVETCAEVVADLFRYGGGRVLSLTSQVQRYLRDLLATRQHIGLSEENYERAGRFRIQMADTFYLWPESPAGRRCVSGS